nr:hypothetical protein [Propionibacterium sp.]
MHRRTDAEALQRLLAAQNSVISTEQALWTGHTRDSWRRLRGTGTWRQLAPGVYLLGLERPTFKQLLWAGHLLGGDASAIGGQAALVCWKIRTEEPDVIELWLPNGRKRVARGPWHYRQDRAGRLAGRRGTLPVIRPEDAILDLADGRPLETFVGPATDALRQGRVSTRSLHRAIGARQRLGARRLWLDTLANLAGVESTLEYLYRRDVERAHGLPVGRRQVSLVAGTRTDVWYDAYCTLIELDGRVGHVEGAFRDLDRDNRHALSALSTARYGSVDIRTRPCVVAHQVGRILRLRGWTGQLRLCPDCPVTPPTV